ncbi:helix-turn-helix domain-containing protein, partial [bacterium]
MPQTIGEQLKQAREERGLSLEQAAQITRVRIHYLKALESDLREQLPSAVQGRGFLRLYADYLGLPVQPLLDQWEGRTPPEAELVEQPPPIEENLAAETQP